MFFTSTKLWDWPGANPPSPFFYTKTNEMHQFLKFVLFCSSILFVSDGLSVHHQESKTVHTASGICTILDSWWWTERPFKTSRVLLQNKINLRNWCILLVLLQKYITMHSLINTSFFSSFSFSSFFSFSSSSLALQLFIFGLGFSHEKCPFSFVQSSCSPSCHIHIPQIQFEIFLSS